MSPSSVMRSGSLTGLRRTVREFIDAELQTGGFRPAVNSWLTGWDAAFSEKLADRGWLGMTIPLDYGGHGATFLERFVVTEELLAVGAPVAAHWIADRQIAPSLVKYGTETQKQLLLPGIAAGKIFFGIGMSEPDSGSDLASVRTRGIRVEGGWRVSGSKVWTSGAHEAHYFIVLARTEPVDAAARHAGLSQFIVDLGAEGVDIRPIASMDGSHHFNEVFLDDVFVADAMVLGELGGGWEQVTSELSYERSGSERFLSTLPALTELVDVTQRGALGADPELGGYFARVTALHHVSMSVARALSKGEPADTNAAIVKVLGTTTEGDIAEYLSLSISTQEVDEASVELHSLSDAALLNRPGFTLRGGTNEILRGVIARGLGLR